jgi:hypothetical protein
MVQVPDSAVQISGDTVTISLQNVAVVDQLQFPTGTGHAPVTLSFTITYTKSGAPREVEPTSHDPLSPFNWEGKVSNATNAGSFTATYNDGSFSAQGTFSSAGFFGQIGTEKNGSFVENSDDQGENNQDSAAEAAQSNDLRTAPRRSIPLKGRVLTTSM